MTRPPEEPDTMAMIKAASWLAEEARQARKGKDGRVQMHPLTAERLSDTLLAAVNRIIQYETGDRHGAPP